MKLDRRLYESVTILTVFQLYMTVIYSNEYHIFMDFFYGKIRISYSNFVLGCSFVTALYRLINQDNTPGLLATDIHIQIQIIIICGSEF